MKTPLDQIEAALESVDICFDPVTVDQEKAKSAAIQALTLIKELRESVEDYRRRAMLTVEYKIPFMTFLKPTCKSLSGCGKCEKCAYIRKHPIPPHPEPLELAGVLLDFAGGESDEAAV